MNPATWTLLVAVLLAVLARQVDGIRTDHHRLLEDLDLHLDPHLDLHLDPHLDLHLDPHLDLHLAHDEELRR